MYTTQTSQHTAYASTNTLTRRVPKGCGVFTAMSRKLLMATYSDPRSQRDTPATEEPNAKCVVKQLHKVYTKYHSGEGRSMRSAVFFRVAFFGFWYNFSVMCHETIPKKNQPKYSRSNATAATAAHIVLLHNVHVLKGSRSRSLVWPDAQSICICMLLSNTRS